MKITNLFLAPIRGAKWFNSHPMNRVVCMRVIAMTLYLTLNSLWLWPLLKLMGSDISFVSERTFPGIPYLFRFMGCMMLFFLTTILPFMGFPLWKVNRSTVKRTSFKKARTRMVRYGAVRFMLMDLGSMLFFELVLGVSIVTVIAWYCVVGLIPLVIMGLAMLHIKTNEWLHQQTNTKGHWLFQVIAIMVSGTLGAVCIKLWNFHPYLVGLSVLAVTTTPFGRETVRLCLRYLSADFETDGFTPQTAARFRRWFDKATDTVAKRIDALFDKARAYAAI